MENKSGIWELCMVFGVVIIVLAGFISAVSASDDQKHATAWSQLEGSYTKIDSLLVQKMEETPDSKIAVIIVMKEQQKAPFNVHEAKSLTISSQKSLIASLENIQARDVQEYWIINAVSATVPAQEIDALAARPDVKKVWLDKEIRLIEPVNDSGDGYSIMASNDDDMMINPMSNYSGDSSDRMIQVSTINYTSASSVDGVAASDSIRLYLRPDPTGPPYEDYLSESPEISTYTIIIMYDDGTSCTWGDYDLDGDITGTDYGYWICFASASSTTFGIKIIINGEAVATFPHLTVPYDEYFLPFSDTITGLDPTTSDGDEVVLEITKISGGDGKILFGAGAPSNIEIPPILPPDYGDDIINAPQMWDQGYDGSGVKISILDSGVDDTHPDLAGRVVAEEDFTDDVTTDDLNGHGTHCAGIAAGGYNAGANVTGVALGASLMNAKVLNQSGFARPSWVISGIEWSVEQNADILSMSIGWWWGRPDGWNLVPEVVTNAVDAGHVVVIAAGNEGPGEGTIGSPAVAYGAIAVAASDSNDAIVDFSSRGPTGDGRVGIDVAAPGYEIIAPNAFWESQNDHVTKSGTSMSCPHVAGAAALLLEADSSLTPGDVERALKNGADDLGYDVWEQGAGRLDVNDAYVASTDGILVDPQWFVGAVRSGSYTKTFTVVNNDVSGKTVSITGSTGDAGEWITLPASVTVPAGGTANFDAIMNVPGDAVGAYKGSIRVNDGIEGILIPVSVNVIWDTTKTGPMTGTVDEDSGGYFPDGDWVYYTLEVPHTTDLNLSLSWTDANNDLDLCLFNSSGDFIEASATLEMPESVHIHSPEAGNWTVAINAYTLKTAQETYTLEITIQTPTTLRGDVNHDGVVTPADAVIVLEMAVRGEYNADADVNRDDKVTSLDALMVLQVAVGAITV